jgi:hypothetical protein
MNGRTDPRVLRPRKKEGACSYNQHGPAPVLSAGQRIRVCAATRFGVHAVLREPCMCVTTERDSLLRPMLAGTAGYACV